LADARNIDIGANWNGPQYYNRLNTGPNSTTPQEWANFYGDVFTQFTSSGTHLNPIIAQQSRYNFNNPSDVSNYNFLWLDRSIDEMALGQGLDMHYHAVIYPQLTPGWIANRQGPNGTELSWSQITDIQENYITNIIKYTNERLRNGPDTNGDGQGDGGGRGFNDVIKMEVLNEVLTPGPFEEQNPLSRETLNYSDGTSATVSFQLSPWFRAERLGGSGYGPNFVKKAFKTARAADGNDILILNHPNRPDIVGFDQDFYELAKWLADDPTMPEFAVGFQMHTQQDDFVSQQHVKGLVSRFGDLGLDVYITELDVSLPNTEVPGGVPGEAGVGATPNGTFIDTFPNFGETNGDNPYANWQDEIELQGDYYERIVAAALSEPALKGITVWTVSDTVPWKDDLEGILSVRELGWDSTNFDGNGNDLANGYKAKPAYFGIREALQTSNPLPPAQFPYGGNVRNAQSWIGAELFDSGGEDVAFNDNNEREYNSSGFRPSERVDITNKSNAYNDQNSLAGTGYAVGYTANGEWLEYTVNNLPAGTYDFKLRYSSNAGNIGDVRIKVNGSTVGTVTGINATGGWNTFQQVTKRITIPSGGSGQRVVRLEFVGAGGMDLDRFQFTQVSAPGQTPFGGSARNARQWVPAEAFDNGGEAGGAYNDDNVRSGTSSFRAGEKVDITDKGNAYNENNSLAGTGYTVGYTASGEWLEYTVTNLSPGPYNFQLTYSSGNANPGDLNIRVDNENVGTVTNISSTGNWNNFTTVTKPITISSSGSGTREVRLTIQNGGNFDLDRFRFVRVNALTAGMPDIDRMPMRDLPFRDVFNRDADSFSNAPLPALPATADLIGAVNRDDDTRIDWIDPASV
ncbi:MAG: cellulase family glycosylhydrolase, partial [Planctomycetota bacterium]